PDGTGVKQVSKDANNEFSSPSWAPDGKYIFVSKAQFGIGSSEIWMYHVDGGSGVQITKSKPTPTTERNKRPNAMGVVASPDEKYLYYAAKLGSLYYNQQLPTWYIARRDRKTGDEDNLIHQIKSAFRPVLSPDGQPRRLPPGSAHELRPAGAPDGKSVVYVTWSSDGGQLWKIPAAGGSAVRLSKCLAVYSNPAWSPDGTKIVLLHGNA